MATVLRTATTFTEFWGKNKNGVLIKSVIPQFDGSAFASQNCAASSESVRAIVEIAKRKAPAHHWPPTPAFIRQQTGDHVGGLRPTQTAAVSRSVWGIGSDIRIADTDILTQKLWARYGATLLVRYAAFSDAGYSGSPGFRGNHSFDVLGIRKMSDGDIEVLISDSLRDKRRAGIPEGAVWVNLKVIQNALSTLDIGGGVSLIERYGSHHGYFSFTLTPEKVPPSPTEVELAFGAHKIRPKRLRAQFDRTIFRTSPRHIGSNWKRIVPKGQPFDAFQRVENKDGAWVGNKAGTVWVLRSGFKFVRYIK